MVSVKGTKKGESLKIKDSGMISGLRGDDKLYIFKSGHFKGKQIHAFGGDGDDIIHIDISVSDKHDFVNGSHVFGGLGADKLILQVNDYEAGKTVNRIDDFSHGEDELYIQRNDRTVTRINLNNLGPGIELIEFHNQQALLIDRKAIVILEGARMANSLPKGVSNPGHDDEENHFPAWHSDWIRYGIPDSVSTSYERSFNFIEPSIDTSSKKRILVDSEQHVKDGVGHTTFGTSSSDYISSDINGRKDILYGGAGHDVVYSGKGNDSVYGGTGNDAIYTGTDRDYVAAGAGNDSVHGGSESDSIYGGSGNDTLFGDSGVDIVVGGDGSDHIYGGLGNDILKGGIDADYIYGDSGDDRIYAEAGSDRALGGPGSDYLFGGLGSDTLIGSGGNDWVYGSSGPDSIDGGTGKDRLFGGWGGDQLFAGQGNDMLNGGLGNDTLVGGPGADVFIFASLGDVDRIVDWKNGGDKLSVREIARVIGYRGEDLFADGYLRSTLSQTESGDFITHLTLQKYGIDGSEGDTAILEVTMWNGTAPFLTNDDLIY